MSNQKFLAYRDEVFARTSLADLILEKTGQRLRPGETATCKCPFHDDSSPSMSVNTVTNQFYCHAAGCGAKGDTFTFMMDINGLTFRQALDALADRCGMPRYETGSVHKYVATAPRPVKPQAASLYPERPSEFELNMPIPPGVKLPAVGEWISLYNPRAGAMKNYRPERADVYRDTDGNPIAVVMRLYLSMVERKYYIPMRLGELDAGAPDEATLFRLDGKRIGWRMEGYPRGSLAPIYGAHRVKEWVRESDPERSFIMIVEGEKTAEGVLSILGPKAKNALVFTPMGGGSAPARGNWRPILEEIDGYAKSLAGRRAIPVFICPDADQPITRSTGEVVDRQIDFTKHILYGLCNDVHYYKACVGTFDYLRVVPPDGVKAKWDFADALEEGWSAQHLLNHMMQNCSSLTVALRPVAPGERPSDASPRPAYASPSPQAMGA